MSRRIIPYLILACGLLAPLCLPAQTRRGEEELKSGLGFFKQEEYDQAVLSFKAILADPAAVLFAPDAYFWSAKAYMALNQLDDAERNLEHFLASYADHPYYSEGRYQKGRLLFLKKDYESAIQACQEFIRKYPRSEFVPNAYFWIGDSLYSLGKLEEAARVFNKIVQDYPQSFKAEAAGYRLSLIDFKKRENELMRLLKWSHEEFLKVVEEFQRREKVYEQAIGAYQQKLAGGTQEKDKGPEESARLIDELKGQNTELKAQLQNLQAQSAARIEELNNLERTLKIKAEALNLKESLLLRYEETEGKAQ
jgi:tetratricopeptide (TPR) repeat protein